MNFYIVSFLLLFPFAVPHSAYLPDSRPKHKKEVAGTANIVFKSADGGQTWQDISKGLPETVQDDYGVDRTVFFADDNGIWLTDGNGLYHNKPGSKAPFWTKETFPGEQASTTPGKTGIFAYKYWDKILQKANGTRVWSPVYANFRQNRVRSVFETAAGTVCISSDYGLFKTTNSGKTWKQVHTGGGKSWQAVEAGLPPQRSISSIIQVGEGFFCGHTNGIFKSSGKGKTWKLLLPSIENKVFNLFVSANVIYAIPKSGGC